MRVDGGIGGDLAKARQAAARPRTQGYDGVWTAETSHDPFFPLLLAGRAHRAAWSSAPASRWRSPATR